MSRFTLNGVTYTTPDPHPTPTISEEETVEEVHPSAGPSEEWTVAELTGYAEDHGIGLGDATRKADILAAIQDAE